MIQSKNTRQSNLFDYNPHGATNESVAEESKEETTQSLRNFGNSDVTNTNPNLEHAKFFELKARLLKNPNDLELMMRLEEAQALHHEVAKLVRERAFVNGRMIEDMNAHIASLLEPNRSRRVTGTMGFGNTDNRPSLDSVLLSHASKTQDEKPAHFSVWLVETVSELGQAIL